MARRGPDADGLIALPNAVLGHRRLAVVDLSPAGNQPMSTPDGRLWTVFNGEIYNHLELRAELQNAGYQYHTRTDTESLLYGYHAWGQKLSVRCRGQWAFAIWDVDTQTLYLSRDRLGEKPLYYYHHESYLAFASSLAALRLVLPACEISPEAVASLLAYEYIPHTECIYTGVQKLAPAHDLVFNRAGLRTLPYWTLDYRHKLDITLPEAERQVENLLDSAVREQTEADVTVGTFLSGGVDSGYVTALAARHKPGIISLTMTVPDSGERDESKNARFMARKHGVTHVEIPLDANCIAQLPALLASGEPLGDSSIIPTAAVAQVARQHMTVVLTGDGGDEVFGGYGKVEMALQANSLRHSGAGKLLPLLAPSLDFLSQQVITPGLRLLRYWGRGSLSLAAAGLDRWIHTYEATPPAVRRLLYGPRLKPLLGRPQAAYYSDELRQNGFNEWWEGVLRIGLMTRLPDAFLYKVDTATMYHSLEARAPFLDHRLLELSAQLPIDCWHPDGHSKSLLKRLAARHNSPEVVYKLKKGFSIPVEIYFKHQWRDLFLELTQNGVAVQLGLFNPDGLRRYLFAHGLRDSYRLHRQLFSILALELWLRVFHKGESPDELGDRLLHSAQKSSA
jgi:asparagine synthase (glutamine-hydrolysing)